MLVHVYSFVELLTTPPGFSEGINLSGSVEGTPPQTVSISELLSGEGNTLDWVCGEEESGGGVQDGPVEVGDAPYRQIYCLYLQVSFSGARDNLSLSE